MTIIAQFKMSLFLVLFSLPILAFTQTSKYIKVENHNGKEVFRIEIGQAFDYKLDDKIGWRSTYLTMVDGETQTFGTEINYLKISDIIAIRMPRSRVLGIARGVLLVSGINILGGATYDYIANQNGLPFIGLGAGLIGTFFLLPNSSIKSKKLKNGVILKIVDFEPKS